MADIVKAPPPSLNPRTTSYEFLGPVGAFLITVGVPILSYALYFGCSGAYDCRPSLQDVQLDSVAALTNVDWWKGLWDNEAAALYLGWYAFTVVAWAVLPGDQVEGKTMRNGLTKKYKINGAYHVYSPLLHLRRVIFFSICYVLDCVGNCHWCHFAQGRGFRG